MSQASHTKAAEHHEATAETHRTAAEHDGKGDLAKGLEHPTKAHGQSEAARKMSTEAHGKSVAHAKK